MVSEDVPRRLGWTERSRDVVGRASSLRTSAAVCGFWAFLKIQA